MKEFAPYFEHTVLKADTRMQDVQEACEATLRHGFAGVCIPPLYVRDARRLIGENRAIRLVTVVGFPMGYSAIAAKTEEVKRAIDEGADDIDAVVNIAAVKSAQWTHVQRDIDSLVIATNMRGKTLKLILECGLLSEAEIRKLCDIAHEKGISWLKTGTGFHQHPATPDMVQQLRALAAPGTKIKASGGIRTLAQARALIDAGAERLGASATLDILQLSK
jgi:deoxyribose-phosphate aldolase